MNNPNTGERIEVKVDQFKGKPTLVIPTGWNKEKNEPYTLIVGLTKAKAIIEHSEDIMRFVETNGTMEEPPV